jgi:hypothetical protein
LSLLLANDSFICLDSLVAIVAALTAETAATVAAPAATVFLRTSFVHIQRSPLEIPAVDFGNGSVPLGIIAHLNESKAPGLTRIPVRDNANAVNGPICFKHRSNRVFGSAEAEVPYKNIFHLNLLSGICTAVNRGRIEQERLEPDVGRCQKQQTAELHL